MAKSYFVSHLLKSYKTNILYRKSGKVRSIASKIVEILPIIFHNVVSTLNILHEYPLSNVMAN